ncbi:hypothetical protein [Caballeronia sp. SBC2]|uniref:hypothetical protein n=1 Tax=Caballeronia sp. SBC2 TaxID=2705547 RepID=UPI0013E18CEE|nr:hypothetical protein [Caballeronia sp. SBC2]QIE30388.1 hypothetical protein SBC2_84650 [Caballeronia sp. SBC2]
MSATTTHTSNPTNQADVPSAPPEAHPRAYVKGDLREVVVTGSRFRMEHDGQQWSNVSVTPE